MRATGSLRRGPTFRSDKYNRHVANYIHYDDEEKNVITEHEVITSNDTSSEKTIEEFSSRQSFTSRTKRWSLLQIKENSQSRYSRFEQFYSFFYLLLIG